jgi:hypothetical protein
MIIQLLNIMKIYKFEKQKMNEIIVQYLQTTTGRVILNYIIQKTLNFL